MDQVSFNIHRYDKAIVEFCHMVVDGFISLDPLLGTIRRVPIVHGGPTRNVRGSAPLDQKLSEIESMATLDMDAIRKTETEKYSAFVYELARSAIDSLASDFIDRMNELAEAVGNTIDAGGQPFSVDKLLDLIDKMLIDFDAEGKPIMPALLVNPQLHERIKHLEFAPEQEQRRVAILARKKAEHDAKKRTRRLSD
jgi:hypothetical protein